MLSLITLLDGANAALFHVEHCSNRGWEYQCRWPESRAKEYREWGPLRKSAGDHALEPMMDPTVAPEVRWRWIDSEDWHLAVPHQWESTRAEFHVILKQPRDFRTDPLVHAVALVGGMPVAYELAMPRRLAAQDGVEVLTITGHALGFGAGTVLHEAGEFVSASAAFAISNSGKSQVTLLPAPPAAPSALPMRGTYAVKTGRLSPEEIDLLKSYVAARAAESSAPASHA